MVIKINYTSSDIYVSTNVSPVYVVVNSNDGVFVPYTGATTNVNLGAFTLTANSIIKSGGTSSQFLKADGSVDSTTYTPSTRNITINGTTQDLSADRTFTVSAANIYSDNGTLTGDRTVTMGAFTLSFEKDITVNGHRIGSGNGNVSTNIAIGQLAAASTTTASQSVFIGYSAGNLVTTANSNVLIGAFAGRIINTGGGNTIIGQVSGYTLTSGTFNTLIGRQSGNGLTTGIHNVVVSAIGSGTIGITTGSYNTIIGSQVIGLPATLSNNIILADGQGNIRIRTWDTGNVGIGTTTDAGYKLDVNGTARVSGDLTLGGSYRILYFGSSSNTYIVGENNDGLYLSAKKIEYSDVTTKYGRFQRVGGVTSFLIGEDGAGRAAVTSSILELFSTTQGFLPPRMTTTQRDAIASPATGLVIYNTTTLAANVYNGTNWAGLGGDNIYTADGTLSGNRTVTLGGFSLDFKQGVNSGLKIDTNADVLINKDLGTAKVYRGLTVSPNGNTGYNASNNNMFVGDGTNFAFIAYNYLAGARAVFGGITGAGNQLNIALYGRDLEIYNAGTIGFKMFDATSNIVLQRGGTFTDAGFRLDVNGTARVNGKLTLSTPDVTNNYLSIGNGVGIADIFHTAYRLRVGGVVVVVEKIVGDTSGTALDVRANSVIDAKGYLLANTFGVGTDTTAISASSIVEFSSTTKGFLPPRMTTTQINAIASPAEGLIAYNTTISHLCCYKAGAWVKLSHSPM